MTITDLFPTASGDSEALGTCDAGFVVGRQEDNKGFRWSPQPSPTGTVDAISPLTALTAAGVADTVCRALAVNNNGVVVGVSDALQGQGTSVSDVRRAFRWDPSVSLLAQDLGTLMIDPNNPGGFLGNSEARAINNNGWIVGVSDTPDGSRHACVWLPFADPATGRTILDLGTLMPDPQNPGGFLGNSEANGVNDDNIIVGTSDATDSAGQSVRRGFDWRLSDQTPRAFGTLAVIGANVFGSSGANAIDVQGITVGFADFFAPGNVLSTQAFRSFAGGHVITGLPMVVSPNIVATAINNDDPAKVVGFFGGGPSIFTARAFTHDLGSGTLTDLTGTLGVTPWVVHQATGVNINGQITGIALNQLATGTTTRAVLLQP
jgi:probable HAF family extracellular repeat protein